MSDYSDYSGNHLSVPKTRRRDSIAVAHDSVRKLFEDKFSQLRAVWDRVGMTEEQRKERMDTAIEHLVHLVDEMFHEETQMEEQLRDSVIMCSRELHSLTKELSMPQFVPGDSWSLMETEMRLREKYEEYSNEKESRLTTMTQLKAEEERLCGRLGSRPFSGRFDPVPSLSQLADLKTHVEDLRKQHETRFTMFYDGKKEITRLLRKIGRNPTGEVERWIVEQSETDYVLSLENLGLMKNALTDLQQEYEEHLAGIMNKIKEMREEIYTWWDKCCVSEDIRQEFPHLHSEDFSEAAYEAHKDEVEKLKRYYEQHQTILDRVKEWERFFERQMYFEARENDPTRYQNRGGALLREEQERKAVEKKFPRIEALLKQDGSNEWQQFRVYGVSIPDYINQKWEQFYADKEREKYEKQRAKMEQLEAERKFGVRQVTPLKSGLRTPQRTPQKSRLMQRNDTFATSSSKTHGQSVMSHMSPVRHAMMPPQPVSSQKKLPLSTRQIPAGLPPPHGHKRKVVPSMQPLTSPVLAPSTFAGQRRPGNEVPQNATLSTNASLLSYRDFARTMLHSSNDPDARQSSFIEEPVQKVPKF